MADPRGHGTVLVVDDEQIVRDTAKCSLERRGYEVLLAENGPAAIDVVRSEGHRIGLVLLDLSMPGMSGEETLPHLRSSGPELEVIVSSGYSEAEASAVVPRRPGFRVSAKTLHSPGTRSKGKGGSAITGASQAV